MSAVGGFLRATAAALVLILVLAAGSYSQQQRPWVVHCGVATGGTSMTVRGVEVASAVGRWMHDWATKPPPTEDEIRAYVRGVARDVLWYWARAFLGLAQTGKLDPQIMRLQEQRDAMQAAADDQCSPCPTVLPQGSSPLASLGTTAAKPAGSPEEVARQAAARYWPAEEVSTAVAVAGAESTYDPAAYNAVQDGMLGLWQINRAAHRQLVDGKDWRDASVNAYMAYRIWLDAGRSWSPWSTYTSGAYRKYLQPTASDTLTAAVSTRSGASGKDGILAIARTMGAPTTPHTDPQGQPAFDIMSIGDLNHQIAERMRAEHARLGLRYVISDMRIASDREGWAWRPYSPITSSGDFRHTAHVHVSYGAPVSAASGPTPPTVADPQDRGCTSGSMPGLKVITWNTYVGDPRESDAAGTARVVRGLGELVGRSPDMLGVQELSSAARKADVFRFMRERGYDVTGGETSHAIFYNTRTLTLTGHQEQPWYSRGDRMEGPEQGDRSIVSATFRTADGRTVTGVNMHQLPQIQRGGGWWPGRPQREKIALEGFGLATTTVRKAQALGPVLLMGDMNWQGDPNGLFRAAGLTSTRAVFGAEDTRGSREIDQVLFTAGTPMSSTLLGRHGSDHEAREVVFADGSADPAAAAPVDGPTPAEFNMPGQRTVEQAITYMQAQQKSTAWGSACLAVVARAYGHESTQKVDGHWYATGQWSATPQRYRHTDGSTPPRGALVYWRTGNVAGHIAISAGGGYVWTSDPPGGRAGSVGKVPIGRVDAWGTRLGWSAPYFVGRTGGVTLAA